MMTFPPLAIAKVSGAREERGLPRECPYLVLASLKIPECLTVGWMFAYFLEFTESALGWRIKKSMAHKRVKSSTRSTTGEHSHEGLKPVFVVRNDGTNARAATSPHGAPL